LRTMMLFQLSAAQVLTVLSTWYLCLLPHVVTRELAHMQAGARPRMQQQMVH